MTRAQLFEQILHKKSYLCIGLDTDLHKLPSHLGQQPQAVLEFNRQIIEATADYCVAYKPNLAFYESMGPRGWEILQQTMELMPPDVLTIADAKRGDIGNTSAMYARAFFEEMHFDALTVAPYMGRDSVQPFLGYPNKWVILLAHTSNEGSADFQTLDTDGQPLYERVITQAQTWSAPHTPSPDQLMYVIGAAHPQTFARVRQLAPEHFLLVPGYGTQGGDLEAVSRLGMNAQCGLLVNSSRAILYASSARDFAQAARQKAQQVAQEMEKYLEMYCR